MRIEVLYIEECPNSAAAVALAEEALAVLPDTDAEVIARLMQTEHDTAEVPFAGSPTFLLNGEDLFPNDGQTLELACRVYATPSGLKGLPTLEQLRKAVSAQLS
ncbi:MAG: thioredoxin family protein [Microbacteriaceae bacterium]